METAGAKKNRFTYFDFRVTNGRQLGRNCVKPRNIALGIIYDGRLTSKTKMAL